jgi:uracil DNA glycosylase
MKEIYYKIILFYAVFFGIIIRGLLVFNPVLTVDENYTWVLLQKPWEEFFDQIKQDVHPHLYYLIVYSLFQI